MTLHFKPGSDSEAYRREVMGLPLGQSAFIIENPDKCWRILRVRSGEVTWSDHAYINADSALRALEVMVNKEQQSPDAG